MKQIRLHPAHFIKYIKYALLLCVIPIIRAVLAFDILAAWLAFTQDLLILLSCGGILAAFWQSSAAFLEEQAIWVRWGVLFRRLSSYPVKQVSAVEIYRPLQLRLVGASRLTVYFKAGSGLRRLGLTLPRKEAAQMAEQLIPTPRTPEGFEPIGTERLVFVLLSANTIATAFVVVLAVRRTIQLFGTGLRDLAVGGLLRLEHLLAAFLPAGLSLLFALLLIFLGISLLDSLLRTFRFTACRADGVLLCRGGLINRTERRILVNAVSTCTVKISPAARLLRYYPIYLSAGCFRGEDLPVLVSGRREREALRRLVPEFFPPSGPLCNPRRKSLPQYLWKPGGALLLLLAMWAVSMRELPEISLFLGVGIALMVGCLLCQIEAIFTEGFCRNGNRSLTLSYSRRFTRYLVTVCTDDVSYSITRLPTAAAAGRCDLRVHTPSHHTYHLRGVEFFRAQKLGFNL